MDPKKALQILQQTGHYSEGKEDFTEMDSYAEDDLGDDALSHVSESSVEKTPEKVFPNGEGKPDFDIYWMCFNFDFLDISLASLRDSEKSIELPFSLRYSPVPAWIKELSYVLSTDEDTPKPKKSAKKRKMPDSCEKGVGTSGSRKSKRLLEQQLTATKSGEFVNCAFFCLAIEFITTYCFDELFLCLFSKKFTISIILLFFQILLFRMTRKSICLRAKSKYLITKRMRQLVQNCPKLPKKRDVRIPFPNE